MTSTAYVAGLIRKRANPEQMQTRYDALIQIVSEAAPTGVRFTYYRAVSKGIVPKTNNGYVMVQRALMYLRETGAIPWSSIVDSSRWMRKDTSWGSLEEMLEDAASSYRRDLWRTADTRVEVWCESESVAGVIGSETFRWDVPLFPIKGQTSASFAHSAAMEYRADRRPVVIYYVGDHDPAGLEIEASLAAKLRKHSGRDDVQVQRLACTPEQIITMALIGTTRSWGVSRSPAWLSRSKRSTPPFCASWCPTRSCPTLTPSSTASSGSLRTPNGTCLLGWPLVVPDDNRRRHS